MLCNCTASFCFFPWHFPQFFVPLHANRESMNKNSIISKYWEQIAVSLLAIIVCCFWLFFYPFIPVAREMSQLFLWNGDYLTERLSVPGGIAQYLGECITQFFINPVYAALVYAILFVVAQQLSSKLLRQFFPTIKSKVRFPLSLLPPILLWYMAMLPHIPLTPMIAALLVMMIGCVVMSIHAKRTRLIILCFVIAVMYWLTGPMSILLVLCSIRWIPLTATLFASCLIGSSYITPYPLEQIIKGIDYDWSGVKEMGTYEEMECDMLIRQQEWIQVLRKFKHPVSPAVRSAVILASYQSGQMSYQELMSKLVVPVSMYDSEPSVFCMGENHFTLYLGSLSSAFIVSELATQLSWTAISQRAAFEAMEYIPNANKSGRALKTLTEICIITGQYALAEKYLSILDKTIFYRRWVKKIRSLVDNPKLIEQYPFMKASRESYLKTKDYFFI